MDDGPAFFEASVLRAFGVVHRPGVGLESDIDWRLSNIVGVIRHNLESSS